MVNVEEIDAPGGFNYTLTLDDATATGASSPSTPASSGRRLPVLRRLGRDRRQPLGHRRPGNDVITGGQHGNILPGLGGSDTVIGGPAARRFYVRRPRRRPTRWSAAPARTRCTSAATTRRLTVTGAMVSDIERLTSARCSTPPGRSATTSRGRPELHRRRRHHQRPQPARRHRRRLGRDRRLARLRPAGSATTPSSAARSATASTSPRARHGQGGVDVRRGGGGDDVFLFDEKFTRDDEVDGGDGFDALQLEGDYSAGRQLRRRHHERRRADRPRRRLRLRPDRRQQQRPRRRLHRRRRAARCRRRP